MNKNKAIKIEFEKDLDYYLNLLNFENYRDAVKFLRYINGKSMYSFHSNSKNRKVPFYRHHIDEDKYPNIGNKKFPGVQDKNKLVYCDLVEHFILHVLIFTNNNYRYKLVDNKSNRNYHTLISSKMDTSNFNKSNGANTLLAKVLKYYIKHKSYPKDELSQIKSFKLNSYDTNQIIEACFNKLDEPRHFHEK